ncbi:MAG: lipid A biosynthesis acyltransferase, partial [Chitinophagaceae bacterium]
MYPIVYGIFYLISLLPLFVLYGIADFAFFILYYVLGYRTKVVMANLETAFPEKTIEERKTIARAFYRNLTQTFVETLKMLSISGKAFDKMYSLDLSAVNNLIDHGKRIQVHSGHQMNWEMANLAFAKNAGSRWVAIYLRQKSEVMDKLLLRIRSRFGGTFISAQGFQNDFKKLTDSQYML